MGNTNLKPEETSQYNVGVTWSSSCGDWLRHFSISADGYYNTVKDKIVALPTMYVWKMMNMGEVDIKGVDVNLSTQFRLPLRTSSFWHGFRNLGKSMGKCLLYTDCGW